MDDSKFRALIDLGEVDLPEQRIVQIRQAYHLLDLKLVAIDQLYPRFDEEPKVWYKKAKRIARICYWLDRESSRYLRKAHRMY